MMRMRVVLGVIVVACGLVLSGCWPWVPVTFELQVVPAAIDDLAQGASTSFLVSISEIDDDPSTQLVVLSATASAGTAAIVPSVIRPGDVAELTLGSAGVPIGSTIDVTVRAARGSESRQATATAIVSEPIEIPDDRLATGIDMRDRFVPWFAAEHPELGIDEETVWTPVPVRPHILEVSFYMFLCEEWELVVWWHVMIPPYDWARLYLRHRSTEMAPSFGAEISSVSIGGSPEPMTPPEEVWR
jgi:hypothetical protein